MFKIINIFILTGTLILLINIPVYSNDKDSSYIFFHYFDSEPFNASVYIKDSLIGFTPFRYFTKEKSPEKILIKKKGYRDFILQTDTNKIENSYYIKLIPLINYTDNPVIKDKDIKFSSKRNWYIISGTGLLTAITAYSAYRFKNRANDYYENYLNYGNREDYNNSNKYDLFYYLSLGISQTAFAGLIYFLLFKE